MRENSGLKKISLRQLISGHPAKQKVKPGTPPQHKHETEKLPEKKVSEPIIRRRGYGSYDGL